MLLCADAKAVECNFSVRPWIAVKGDVFIARSWSLVSLGGRILFSTLLHQSDAGSCGQSGATDGARSRDAPFAVLGESRLRMGLYCCGLRCLADARSKR
ncbi:hypothetical protein Nepgr_018752 [Nepenthes gracilis]|uniref:Uncharacterized protein n=1 Tax=Nepenthes gracilis TaxID=150966 RepID=A0AAD3SVS8_NEPGR|nr:hypothetical protein Nepgr_018752 [Nepenthes gracilis]